MLQIITSGKIKAIAISIGILFSISLNAQTGKSADKSSIVMTESELNSFLTTIADARRTQLKERERRNIKQDLADLRLKYQQGLRAGVGGQEVSNQQLLNEIRYLNQRIDNLTSGNSPRSRDNSTIVVPGVANTNQPYSLNEKGTTIIPSNAKKIKELQAKIDSLKIADGRSAIGNQKIADSINRISGKLSDARKKMDKMEAELLAAKKASVTDDSAETRPFFTQQVYFDNNSEKLHDEYRKYIQDLTQLLITYPEAKVMLQGWASPVGSADYNKRLSMRRAESVRKAFINNRIDSKRILTAFKGEDTSGSAQHARRVEMSIIIP